MRGRFRWLFNGPMKSRAAALLVFLAGLLSPLVGAAEGPPPPPAIGDRAAPTDPLADPLALPPGEGEQRVRPQEKPRQPRASLTGELSTKRFRILHTEDGENAAQGLAEILEPLADELGEKLGAPFRGVVEIRVGRGREEYESISLPGREPPSWSQALAYPDEQLVLIDVESLNREGGHHNLRHELVHIALGQISLRWPRWFHEGMANLVTGERDYALGQYATLVRAVAQERIFELSDLDRGFPERAEDVDIAYAQSTAFVRFLVERHGRGALAELFRLRREGDPFDLAFAKAFSTTVDLEERAFTEELPQRYSVLPLITGGTTFMAIAAALAFVGYLRRQKNLARRLGEMEAEELREEQEAREIAELEAQLQLERLSAEVEAGISAAPPGQPVSAEENPEKVTLH